MAASIPAELVQAAVEAARESGRAVADVSLEVIARRAGVSRVTLYRRIGSRSALDEAVRARGVDPGGRPDVRERAVAAAAALVREGGLGALTLDGVAARAACSVPALHSQLGGREGLLAALFERYSPLPQVEHLLETPATLADGVRAIYAAAYDAVVAQPGLLQALLADALARPEGPTRRLLAERYLPRVFASVGRWLGGEVAAGRCRPLPLPLLLQLLAGPLLLHATTRDLVERVSGIAPTDREDVIEKLTAAYCRAVGLGAADGAGDAEEDR